MYCFMDRLSASYLGFCFWCPLQVLTGFNHGQVQSHRSKTWDFGNFVFTIFVTQIISMILFSMVATGFGEMNIVTSEKNYYQVSHLQKHNKIYSYVYYASNVLNNNKSWYLLSLGWLIVVQFFATLALMASYMGQCITVALLLRWPLDIILRFEVWFCGTALVLNACTCEASKSIAPWWIIPIWIQ